MNCAPAPAASAHVCANCGKAGSDGVKLRNCTACLLVKYCGVDCQRAHRKKHKKACKKRAAELKAERLYGQDHERPEGDSCPICTLPIPLPMEMHSSFYICCIKRVCNGCALAAKLRGMGGTCAFCRTPTPEDDASTLAMVQKRIAAGDADAMEFLAISYYHGGYGLEKDVERAIELWTKAAELGSNKAHFNLGRSYYNGYGVGQDQAKAVEHWQHAAMKGDVSSRHGLGTAEYNARNYHLAVKHYMISAKMGDKDSLDEIKEMFSEGYATKAQYAEALKGYQVAVEETPPARRSRSKRLSPKQAEDPDSLGKILDN